MVANITERETTRDHIILHVKHKILLMMCVLGKKKKKKEAKETWIRLNLPFNLQFTGHKEQDEYTIQSDRDATHQL